MHKSIIGFFIATLLLAGCGAGKNGGGGINIFSLEDDKALGKQVDAQVTSDTSDFVVLNRGHYTVAYSHLDRIANSVLNSGKVRYKNEFDWTFRLIHNDTVLNAFAAPGGYIYVYTGLIKFLEQEDDLAGVVAHEIAHVDQRHSTQQLTKAYGIAVLLEVALGKNQNVLTDIAATLATLKFSRDAEEEADEYSVTYLCPTTYRAAGAADFFVKLQEQGQLSPPEFLSTHPSPVNRVENIQMRADTLGCPGTGTYDVRYNAFKKSLPGPN